MTSVDRCPVCGGENIAPHCGDKSTTCRWVTCRNVTCRAVMSPARGLGYRVMGKVARRFTFGTTA